MKNDPASWELPGSSGIETTRWDVIDVHGQGNERTYRCDISLQGRFYGETLDPTTADGMQDFCLVIRGLQLRHDGLLRFTAQIREWLALPAPELPRSRLEVSCEMGGLFDQSLRLTLGQRDDMLSGRGPIATLSYLIGRMKGELAYPVDQSCLGSMADGMERCINA
jgi:hypothetical protein